MTNHGSEKTSVAKTADEVNACSNINVSQYVVQHRCKGTDAILRKT